MRTSLLLLTLLVAFGARSQSLTVAEVYDFQPGDVFQTRNSAVGPGPAGPPGYVTETIQQRFYAATLDTLFYVVERTLYQPPTLNDPPVLITVTDTLVYTDLDQPATHYALMHPCHAPLDSIGTSADRCGQETWTAYTYNDTCFEPDMWVSQLIRGCGGPYFQSFQPVGQLTLQRELIYFHKGAMDCGSLVTGVAEEQAVERLAVYPNPASDRVHLRGAASTDQVRVFDQQGRPVMEHRTAEGLDVARLGAGLYRVELVRGGAVKARGAFIKQ